jgi:hypothetical protein
MAESVVFISRHRINNGKLDELKQRLPAWLELLKADKPSTVLFHAYLSDDESEVSFVHVFPDAEAMDLHFVGAEQRSAAAYEFFSPQAFTIYGRASQEAIEKMAREAAQLSAELHLWPGSLSGFARFEEVNRES